MFYDVSQCFTCVSWCFTMFNNVLWCLASCTTIGGAESATSRPPIASGIATTLQGSAITPQKSAMAPQGSSISLRTWSHAKLHPEWRLELLWRAWCAATKWWIKNGRRKLIINYICRDHWRIQYYIAGEMLLLVLDRIEVRCCSN